jgi:hypothetical protein
MANHFTADHLSEADWLRFLDHPGDREIGETICRHTSACAGCASLLESLVAVRDGLEAGGAQIRAALRTPSPEIDLLLERCLTRIQSSSHSRWSPSEATLLLRLLLEPICGRGTTGATMDLARRRSTGPTQDLFSSPQLTSGNWNLFISNLSDAMSSICGAAAGTLVERAGFSIALQEG